MEFIFLKSGKDLKIFESISINLLKVDLSIFGIIAVYWWGKGKPLLAKVKCAHKYLGIIFSISWYSFGDLNKFLEINIWEMYGGKGSVLSWLILLVISEMIFLL